MDTVVAIYINIHCPTVEEAKLLSKAILEKKLAGTIKITPKVHLMYYYEGKFGGDDTALMTIKTTEQHRKDIEAFIYENHSWGTPCVEVFPIINDHC